MVSVLPRRHGGRADRNMSADRDIVSAQLARNDPNAILVLGVRNPEQSVRHQFAETAMDLAQTGGGGCASAQAALVDPCLDGDVRCGLVL